MKKNLFDIDGTKLKKELTNRNLSYIEVSKRIGYSDAFISNSIKRKTMNKPGLNMLETLYNIKYDDIKPDEEMEVCCESVTDKAIIDVKDDSNKDILKDILKQQSLTNNYLKDIFNDIHFIKCILETRSVRVIPTATIYKEKGSTNLTKVPLNS